VQVPEEIWAGESRPLFAVLNGAYNDGSPHTGDVPWSYSIRWEVAFPELVMENDIIVDYEPPGTGDDFTPAPILTATHRLKYDTSPLYLGDMTALDAGCVYVRAIIEDVHISNDEVVTSGGTVQDLKSVWAEVRIRQDLDIVDLDGNILEVKSVYPADSGTDRGDMVLEASADPLYGFTVIFEDELDANTSDMVTVWLQGEEYELSETETTSPYDPADDSKYFRYDSASTICTVELENYAGFDENNIDVLDVEIHYEDGGQINITDDRTLREMDDNSLCFAEASLSVLIAFDAEPASDAIDEVKVSVQSDVVSLAHEAVLREMSVDSLLFRNTVDGGDETEIRIQGTPSFSSGSRDEIDVLVSISDNTTDDDSRLTLQETGVETMVFVPRKITDQENGDYPPLMDPNVPRLRVKRFPAVQGDTLPFSVLTEVDDVSISPAFSAAALAFFSEPFILRSLDDALPEEAPSDAKSVKTNGDYKKAKEYGRLNGLRETEGFKDNDRITFVVISDMYYKEKKKGAPEPIVFLALVGFDVSGEWLKVDKANFAFYFPLSFPNPNHPTETEIEHEIRNNYGPAVEYLEMVRDKEQAILDEHRQTVTATIPVYLGTEVYSNTGATYESFKKDLERFKGETKENRCRIDILELMTHGGYDRPGVSHISFYGQSEENYGWRRVFVGTTSNETKFIHDFFHDEKNKDFKPTFVHLSGCSLAHDPSNTEAKEEAMAEKYRQLFNARVLLAWGGTHFTKVHNRHSMMQIYKQPHTSLKDRVKEINEDLEKNFYAETKPLHETFTKAPYNKCGFPYLRLGRANGHTFRLKEALDDEKNW